MERGRANVSRSMAFAHRLSSESKQDLESFEFCFYNVIVISCVFSVSYPRGAQFFSAAAV